MKRGLVTALISFAMLGGVIATICIADEYDTMTREYIDIEAVYNSYEKKELTTVDEFKSSADTEIQFHDYMADDTTGLYRYSIINTEEKIQDHAVEYYKAYFSNDNEIHFILNYNDNTVTQIDKTGNQLFLIIRTYDSWEQGFNIKDFTSGEELACYVVDTDTNEVFRLVKGELLPYHAKGEIL
jgi:hypothetical protein